MKQTLFILAILLTSKLSLGQYQVKLATSNYTQPNMISQQAPPVQQAQEYRVIAYYKSSYTSDAEWKSMTIKVQAVTNSYGREELKVIAYKDTFTDNWRDCSSRVSATYGDMKKMYTYEAFVSSYTVYFNL